MKGVCALLLSAWMAGPAFAAVREERFDREPPDWEGVNHRSTHFTPKTVSQNFGHSPTTRHAGGEPGEIGGRIHPAGEAAYYGYRLPVPATLATLLEAEGSLYVAPGSGHFLLGFFNAGSLNEWRTPNTLVARINSRGQTFHCHLEYCSSRWRAEAGVIGEIVRGERIRAKELVAGQAYRWKLRYDPAGADGKGVATFEMAGQTARCELLPAHRQDGATFTHFGLLPVLKAWDGAGEAYLDDIRINGVAFSFLKDPGWEGQGNRRTYTTTDTRPRFDFGWSPTDHAGGRGSGELGGLIFRGDCREPARMACYGAKIELLTLQTPLLVRGKVAVLRAVSDSTASIGFYHSTWSMRTNASQQQSIPMDYLGINIEGPSSEGFFFYPVYRVHGEGAKALGSARGEAPRIYPDRRSHDWFLQYDPEGANGRGQIMVGLDEARCTLEVEPGHREIGASFNRFGLCTPWIDGNSVTVYFDDLTFTHAPF